MRTELFREMTCLFLQNELGHPTFLFQFVDNTTLRDISKFEELFVIQLSNIPINSLLQSHFRRFTGSVQTLDFYAYAYYFITFIFTATLRRFTVTLFCHQKNNAYILLLVITLLK